MNNPICLDSSVIIKYLTWEDGSEEAVDLMNSIIEKDQTIVLPDFAWVEIGSVLRKKVRRNEIKSDEAEEIWQLFCRLKIINYVQDDNIINLAWQISNEENLPTLYDAAYIAVAKVNSSEDKPCEFWTADEKLINSLTNKDNIKLLTTDYSNKQR